MNEQRAYRPVFGGVGIVASTEGRWATLGLVLTGGGRTWGLTALHALGDLSSNPNIEVWQGPRQLLTYRIALCRPADLRVSQAMDIAAFPLDTALDTRAEIAGLGPWRRTLRRPVADERVVKVASRSGIAAGRVRRVMGATVEIERLPGYPGDYDLAEGGDSGAVWFSHPAMEPLGVHRAVQTQGGRALATTLIDALPALNLAL